MCVCVCVFVYGCKQRHLVTSGIAGYRPSQGAREPWIHKATNWSGYALLKTQENEETTSIANATSNQIQIGITY